MKGKFWLFMAFSLLTTQAMVILVTLIFIWLYGYVRVVEPCRLLLAIELVLEVAIIVLGVCLAVKEVRTKKER